MTSLSTGVFGSLRTKTRKYLDEKKAERDQEELRTALEKKEEMRESNKSYSQESKIIAIEHEKNKALATINDPYAPLGKKVKAINEYYKDHSKPKLGSTMQELSDRAYVNRYRRDMRLEKASAIRQAALEDKTIKKNNAAFRMAAIKQRNENLQMERKANQIIQQERAKMRRIR